MKVLACDGIDPAAVKRIREAGHEVVEAKGLAAPDLLTALRGVHGLLVRSATKVTADVLAGAPDLRVVVRAGRWEKSRYSGREIFGRTLGIIGFGRIGQQVALRARAFGMPVIAFDELVKTGPAGFPWVRHVAKEALLAEADVVTLHLPLTEHTRHSIGARELSLMKPDAVLVNASRGGVVDETALGQALAAGRPRAAAIDVFEREPAPADHPLLRLPNVLALPHLGASTLEAQRRAGTDAAEALLEALATLPAS